ncbi:MAG: hypothetical protein ACRD1R_10935 [Acidobacteriota bacterium]
MQLINIFLCSFLLLSTSALAADAQLEKIGSVPEGIAPEVAALLTPDGVRVSSGGSTIGEFWLRQEMSLNDSPGSQLGVTFGKLPAGTLVGVVHFPESWKDYKDQPIAAGVYTLRYGVQPADGNHMGVSVYRDFLLLAPAAEDSSAAAIEDGEALVKLSTKTTGTPHPAILALFPLYEEISEPTLVQNEMDQPTLAVTIGSVTLGLVIQGHGEVL